MLAYVLGAGWAPTVVSSGKIRTSGRNSQARHSRTGCGAEGLDEQGQFLEPWRSSKKGSSWDGGKRVDSGEEERSQWGWRPLGATFLVPSLPDNGDRHSVKLSSLLRCPCAPAKPQTRPGGVAPPKEGRAVPILGLDPLLSLLGVSILMKDQREEEDCDVLHAAIT